VQLKEIMTQDVETIRPDSKLQDAASKMKSLDVGSLPVCDGRRLVGILTDRDITVRAVADGRDPADTKVSDMMTSEMIYCFEDQSLEDAARLMQEHQIRRLPIVDRKQQLVGIVSLGDVALEDDNNRLSGEALEEISKPSQQNR
jgi:CBS domain-containing protein